MSESDDDAPKSSPSGTAARPDKPSRAAVRRELRKLARDFADDIMAVLDQHGVWDAAATERPSKPDDDKRVRRSPDALDKVKARILSELATRAEAVSIGSVAATLGLSSRQITHPMSLLVEDGLVNRDGIRRGARYALAPAGRATVAKKKRAKKKKAARKRG